MTDLTDKDIDGILKIIDESGYDEIRLEMGDFKLHVNKAAASGRLLHDSDSAPLPSTVRPQADLDSASKQSSSIKITDEPTALADSGMQEGLITIRAPMLGTFYRSSSPDAKPFVEIGTRVKADDTVCLIEVMKLFNSVKAGVDGIVIKIIVENGAMVEYEQPLILIEHSLIDEPSEVE